MEPNSLPDATGYSGEDDWLTEDRASDTTTWYGSGFKWWVFSAGRNSAYAWLKLGPVTLAFYRYLDERWRFSVCAMNQERFVWPPLR